MPELPTPTSVAYLSELLDKAIPRAVFLSLMYYTEGGTLAAVDQRDCECDTAWALQVEVSTLSCHYSLPSILRIVATRNQRKEQRSVKVLG